MEIELAGGAVKVESDTVEGIDEDDVRSAYESILASDAFQKAHRMRRLFRYLMSQVLAVEKGTISEYTIGIEVFDRNPEDYISEDPAIRVQVGRLRHRLAAYYTDHAVSGDVEITIPVGTYTPVFRRIVRPEKRVGAAVQVHSRTHRRTDVRKRLIRRTPEPAFFRFRRCFRGGRATFCRTGQP